MDIATIRFRDLPFITRFVSMLGIYMAWVMIAEFIIDRHGLDRYLPFYKVGNFCVYDAVIVTALIIAWWRLHRTR